MSNAHDALIKRVQSLQEAGYQGSYAFQLAIFEERVNRAWPKEWGADLVALVFGDFDPPNENVTFSSLGIILEPEVQVGTIVQVALTVIKARVAVPNQSIEAVRDAARRLNLLCGALSYSNQGAPIRWWCHLTSPSAGGRKYSLLEGKPHDLLALVDLLPSDAKRQVEAAMYWLRAERSMLLELQARPDELALFADYWNAFECLVEAVVLLSPPRKLSRNEKIEALNSRLATAGGRLDPALVSAMYREIVDTGFREKAIYALRLCAGTEADEMIRQAFNYEPKTQSLYSLRNAINHGTIDVNDPETTMLLEYRFGSIFRLIKAMMHGIFYLRLAQLVAPTRQPHG